MPHLQLEQKIKIVKWFYATSSVTQVQRNFCREYGCRHPPDRKTISRIVKKFQTKGTVNNQHKGNSGRRRSTRTAHHVNMIHEIIARSPRESIRRLSAEVGISRTSVHRILRTELNLIPYKIHSQASLANKMLQNIRNKEEFEKYEKAQNLFVIHFLADWAPQCEQMNEVLLELAKQDDLKAVTFATILAEDIPEVSQKFEITAVPTFLILREGNIVERVDGANAAELSTKVKTQAAKASLLSVDPSKLKEDLNARLKRLINSSKCFLFMKGSPETPKCGFSKNTVELLNKHDTDFGHFDILTNEEIRQGLKTYSNWPTYPQLYVNGELIGGLDILKEMDASGDLENLLPKRICLERLKGLINRSPLMIFMKGEPSQPKCGFSRQLTDILEETGLKYDTFDILSDEEVRQGLKTFFSWPTYPQVYVKGELIGGLDIIKDLKADGSLLSTLKGE